MKVSEILDAAADQIERAGWARDWYEVPPSLDEVEWTDCRVCAGGGINVAAGFEPDFDDHAGLTDDNPAVSAFMAFARRIAPDREVLDVNHAVTAVIQWNDADGRAGAQVVTELRAAAASEREAGK